jgi:hypothetical protein
MWIEHAIYTSLERRGRSGYHVVARSAGISESDATLLGGWCPSHGSLIVDDHNRQSVSFHRLTPGRYVIARTCEGPPEYSGRGGRQLYTHALVFETSQLQIAANQVISLFRAARSMGHMQYSADPPAALKPLELPDAYPERIPKGIIRRPAALEPESDFPRIARELCLGRDMRMAIDGDRLRYVEELLGHLPKEAVLDLSFTTSLRPSKTRPFQLLLESSQPDRGAPLAG